MHASLSFDRMFELDASLQIKILNRDIQIDNAITDCPDLSFYIYALSIYIDHYHEYRRSISVARGSFKDVGSAMDGNNNRRERLCSPLS